MLISQSILNRFGSNFGFYISWPILAKYMIPLRISTTQNLNKSQALQMLKSQSILKRFCSNFGFYISGPIITKYIIPHQISNKPPPSNIKISTNLNYFKCFYLSQFSTNLDQTLDSTSHDQSWKSIWYHFESQSLKISNNLNHFKCLNLSQLSTDFIQTLDSTYQGQS